jgi:hypothetical protein
MELGSLVLAGAPVIAERHGLESAIHPAGRTVRVRSCHE